MSQHLKPLYIKSLINGRPFSQVFTDRGAILNVMPLITLKKLGKGKLDLIFTNMKMINFTGNVTATIGILGVDIIIRPKTLSSAFYFFCSKC